MESTYRKTDIMYVPALLLFAVFVVLPFCDGARIAFTNWNGFSQKYAYVGFANFKRLFQDENVRIAFANTFAYGVGSTLLQQILGLAYALLLNLRFPARTPARAIIYLPVLLAGGGFRHGQHLAFDPDNPPPLCNLFVNMLQRLGIEEDAFGTSTGTLTGLSMA